MEMRIGARNKITRTTKKPDSKDPNYGTWVTKNQKVKSWLIDSMSPSLMQRFIRLPTTNEIWEAVKKPSMMGLMKLEIDHRSASQEETVQGVIGSHSAMTTLRVHIFLSGLDSEFYQVRGEILRSTKEELSIHMANAAHSGSGGKGNTNALFTNSRKNNWIIDTCVSDHMIGDSSNLISKGPSSDTSVSTANGSVCPIVGQGSLTLANNLTLNSVLVVPSLEHNLLSVGQITSALQ
nr:hypothetical protein [Tanacetum cinerariifolium]